VRIVNGCQVRNGHLIRTGLPGSALAKMQVLAGSVRVKVDADRLIQVFKNLFSNAVKFSPFNAGIDITVLCHEGQVEIRVRDYGTGIPENFMPRLFQPFTQADGSDHRSSGGSGLGLAISRGLVERMGGHIRAESVYGQGATFIIELPCVDAVECEAVGEEGDHVAA
jgi:signal transduction histidine kinase